jgi:hypothetical protein
MQQTFTVEEAAKLISVASEKTGKEQLTLDEVLRIADELGVEPQAVKAVALAPVMEKKPAELRLNFPVVIAWIAWTTWTAMLNLPGSSQDPSVAWGYLANYMGSFLVIPVLLGIFCGRKRATCLLSAATAVTTIIFVYATTLDWQTFLSNGFLAVAVAICLTMVGSLLTEYFLRFRSHQR